MKKYLVITLIFFLGLLAGVCLRHQERIVMALELAPVSGGDVNGDGMVNITDAVYLLNFLFIGGEPPPPPAESRPLTTLYVTRHFEKGPGNDPGLTEAGQRRAQLLAQMLANSGISSIITSELRRTIETVLPLSENLAIAEDEFQKIGDINAVVDYIRSLPQGTTAILSHHSFTLHQILTGLCVPGHENIRISGSAYDNLFIVTFPDGGTPKLHHLKHGELPEPCPLIEPVPLLPERD
ncbi:MAG: histidine phosphatase family protein [Planctomycetota bacterium]|nr:histidine phosphatase family protein [Planctomycetota bacterium]